MNRASVVSIVFILLLASAPVWAQVSTSSIAGVVTDSSGAFVPGASVQVKNEDTGIVYEGSTAAAGNYSFASLPPGPYTITVSKLRWLPTTALSRLTLSTNSRALTKKRS